MVKILAIRTYILRVIRMVTTNIPKLIDTCRLSMQVIGRWGRAHKGLTSTFIIPLMPS